MGIMPDAKRDLVCGDSIYQTVTGGAAHRIFASGNERSPVRLNSRYPYGIPVEKKEQFTLLYDLVNQSKKDQVYYIQMVCEHCCA
jgi:hypothetical protein